MIQHQTRSQTRSKKKESNEHVPRGTIRELDECSSTLTAALLTKQIID
jgi:hypothetical protein